MDADLDVTKCKTEEMKRKATNGGWKVYYGPRVYDSKVRSEELPDVYRMRWFTCDVLRFDLTSAQVGVNLVALFFPVTSAAAASNLYAELENQANELVKALEFAVQQEGNQASFHFLTLLACQSCTCVGWLDCTGALAIDIVCYLLKHPSWCILSTVDSVQDRTKT